MNVCDQCFSDYAIARFIQQNATATECSYCSRSSAGPIAAEMDEVLSFIASGISRLYDYPENCLPYDSSEGGWQLANPTDGYELVSELSLLNEDSSGYDELFQALTSSFSDRSYVPRNLLNLSESEWLTHSWGNFCEAVKHESRFVLFKLRPRRSRSTFPDPDDLTSVPVHAILERIGQMLRTHDMIRELPRRTALYRARQHTWTHRPRDASTIGAPPQASAIQSRMSPAGIPMFYGAENIKTAFLETFDPKVRRKRSFSIGRFETARKLRIADFSSVPNVPSMFDELQAERREELMFLNELAGDISKPIARDGKEHYEYVPTQIVSEYLRRVFRYNGSRLDGVAFKSSRTGAGISYCIFSNASGCSDSFRIARRSGGFPPRQSPILVLTELVCRRCEDLVHEFGTP